MLQCRRVTKSNPDEGHYSVLPPDVHSKMSVTQKSSSLCKLVDGINTSSLQDCRESGLQCCSATDWHRVGVKASERRVAGFHEDTTDEYTHEVNLPPPAGGGRWGRLRNFNTYFREKFIF